MKKKELAVGDSAEIEFVFSSGRYQGKMHKSAAIITNDTTAKQLSISLTVEVIVNPDSTFPLVISPSYLDFSPLRWKKIAKEIVVDRVMIKNVSDKEIKLKLIDSPVGFFKIGFSSKKIKPSEEIELEARVNRKLKDDSFKKSITLELDDQAKSRFTIPVKREIRTQKQKRR